MQSARGTLSAGAAIFLALVPFLAPLLAQSAATFEVVSIKANRSGAAASETDTSPGRLSFVNATPLSLLRRAFGVQDFQITGYPNWVATERYDVIATVDNNAALSDRERQPHLQRMFADRWGLRSHMETKERSVYALVVVDATKLLPHTGSAAYGMKVEPGDRIVLRSTRGNIGRLVEILNRYTDRIVMDGTGLGGEYDFTLEWVQNPGANVDGPTLFTALREQLGLRLESTRRSIPVVVIDRIDRPSQD